MTVRQATVDDAEGVLAFLSAFWADGCDTVVQTSSLLTVEQEREWLANRSGDGAVVFVAEQDRRIVGVIDAAIPPAHEFHHNCEFGMSVLDSHRNQGIGRTLIEKVLGWAESKGLWRVELNVFSSNSSAVKLYSSMGFIQDGCRQNAVKLKNGTFCDLVHMYKYTGTANKALQRTC